jgi:hypothetical protein
MLGAGHKGNNIESIFDPIVAKQVELFYQSYPEYRP